MRLGLLEWLKTSLIIKTARPTIPYVHPDRVVANGGTSGARPPHLKSVPPLFHVWPPGCCIHPILYLKKWPPFCFLPLHLVFGPPLLLNLGDGPATRDEILQSSRPISPRVATGNTYLQMPVLEVRTLMKTSSLTCVGTRIRLPKAKWVLSGTNTFSSSWTKRSGHTVLQRRARCTFKI